MYRTNAGTEAADRCGSAKHGGQQTATGDAEGEPTESEGDRVEQSLAGTGQGARIGRDETDSDTAQFIPRFEGGNLEICQPHTDGCDGNENETRAQHAPLSFGAVQVTQHVSINLGGRQVERDLPVSQRNDSGEVL